MYFYIINKYNKNVYKVKIYQQVLVRQNTSEIGHEITFIFDHFLKWKNENITNIYKKFLEWFIGFTEGDGSFIVSK